MPKTAIAIGLFLVILGLVSYFGSLAGYFAAGHASATALIPCALGAVLVICGLLALNPAYLKHAMHAAASLALLGLLAALFRLITTAIRGTFTFGVASISQIIMAVLCALFVALAIHSFIQVRRQRSAGKNA